MTADQNITATEASYNEDANIMPARTIIDPADGSRWYDMSLPPPPVIPEGASAAERLRIESEFGAKIAQVAANRRAFKQHLEDIGYEGAKDGFWYWWSRELKYGWRLGYRIYKALGGVH